MSTEENTFSALSGDADISAYQDVDLSQINQEKPTEIPTENKLSNLLIRVIFIAKALTWISLCIIACMALYSWSRQQSQESWLMQQSFNQKGSIGCKWMNREKDKNLRRDSVFMEYLKNQNKTNLINLENSSQCMSLDTIAEWLSLENAFANMELSKEYQEIIPKKLL